MAISAQARSMRFAKSVTAAVGADNPASEAAVLGILSLVIWALLIVVTAKYVVILLRADNHGEGGTLALMALAYHGLGQTRPDRGPSGHRQRGVVLRRRDDHAGAVRAVRRRRPEDRDAGIRCVCGADRGADPGGPLCRSVAWHGKGRRSVRSDHAGLVHCAGRRRRLAHRRKIPTCWRRSIRCMGSTF